jgi:hypothetical protein
MSYVGDPTPVAVRYTKPTPRPQKSALTTELVFATPLLTHPNTFLSMYETNDPYQVYVYRIEGKINYSLDQTAFHKLFLLLHPLGEYGELPKTRTQSGEINT